MTQHSTQAESLSTPRWERLEAWTRAKIQEGLQAVLEEEVTELLGRVTSARRAAVDAPVGYRNGYGKPRRLALTSGTITVRRPRVRGLEERFAADGGGTSLPAAQRPRAARRRGRGSALYRWSVRVVAPEGRRLIRIYTPIDKTSCIVQPATMPSLR